MTLSYFISGCANSIKSENAKEEYFVFFNSNYMKLNTSKPYRTYPWVIEEFEKSNRPEKNDAEEILMIHGCGLFEVKMEGVWLRDLGENVQNAKFTSINAFVPGGEFCNIAHLISGKKLLKIKLWNGKYYIVDYWKIEYETDEKLVIYESDSIVELGIENLYRDINIEKSVDACEPIEYLSPVELDRIMKEPYVIKKNNRVCFTKAVYLNEIPSL